jgi:tetratricopeptide (TPR) repeat protein
VDDLLKHADNIKTSNNTEFLQIVQGLDRESSRFSGTQHAWLDYLKAWQLGYTGDYEAAVPALKAVITETADPTLRVRAQISLINDQALTSHYGEAYAGLSELLDIQPQVADKDARMLVFAVAALLYNEAGQYDLALNYAERWRAEDDATQRNAAHLPDARRAVQKRQAGLEDREYKHHRRLHERRRRAFRKYRSHVRCQHRDGQGTGKGCHQADARTTPTAADPLGKDFIEFHSILARAYLVTEMLRWPSNMR